VDQRRRQRRRSGIGTERQIRGIVDRNQGGRPIRLRGTSGRLECRRRGTAWTGRLEQHAHRTFAARADAEQDVVGAAHVVLDRARHAALQDLLRVELEIRFQAAAAEQPQVAAVGHDEHACSRLAIGRAGRRNHGRENTRLLPRGRSLEQQFKTRVEACVEAGHGHARHCFKTQGVRVNNIQIVLHRIVCRISVRPSRVEHTAAILLNSAQVMSNRHVRACCSSAAG
jgi:hypothetical protein